MQRLNPEKISLGKEFGSDRDRCTFQDLYEDVDYGVLTPQTKIKVKVNPSGVVILRCNLNIDDVFRYSPYSPFNQVFKVRQNSFE